MAEQCSFCGNTHLTPKTTRYIHDRNGEMLVVEQVPCLECDDCGEQYFEIAVLKRIEADHRDIAKHRKQANNPVGAGCRAEVRVAGTVMRATAHGDWPHRLQSIAHTGILTGNRPATPLRTGSPIRDAQTWRVFFWGGRR
ncbi:type II toxin-antitoxin system MqsA family antitoxin [uncultured Thiocystis sp.]|jgi:YgiT-type zinc finger domain-containing protein|uniref:type II toxin-antitoxin system MqsA family antitoxin n=1 Tax=uncultured Thiocystis sp. TaxID=1202134 RepID=UPI0025F24872|nr:type II toxin-antitoxin system MqsA family antitoxin [uncultured Thiocystis sp.]